MYVFIVMSLHYLSFPLFAGLVTTRVMSCTLKSGIVWISFARLQIRPALVPLPIMSTINCTWFRLGSRQTGVKWPELQTCFSPAINPTATCASPSSFRSTRQTCGATNLRPTMTTLSLVSPCECVIWIKTLDYFSLELIRQTPLFIVLIHVRRDCMKVFHHAVVCLTSDYLVKSRWDLTDCDFIKGNNLALGRVTEGCF